MLNVFTRYSGKARTPCDCFPNQVRTMGPIGGRPWRNSGYVPGLVCGAKKGLMQMIPLPVSKSFRASVEAVLQPEGIPVDSTSVFCRSIHNCTLGLAVYTLPVYTLPITYTLPTPTLPPLSSELVRLVIAKAQFTNSPLLAPGIFFENHDPDYPGSFLKFFEELS